MTQAEALDILKTGESVFLTGEPGAGKTYTINRYVSYLREHTIEPAITASTGIAATHIHGMTLHSWSGIGIMRNLNNKDITEIAKSRYIAARVRKTRVLIIDEVSMIDAATLDTVDQVCRKARRSEEPFGGLQVVLVGDFFQLPPVSKAGEPEVLPAFQSYAWRALNPIPCYLTEQHRQADEAFLRVLSAIRENAFEEGHFQYLEERVMDLENVPRDVTRLFSHNVDVDAINTQELSKLPSRAQAYRMAGRGPERLLDSLKRGCLSPELLVLKQGASVMFTKNNPMLGFANGTLGVVVGFDSKTKYPIIQTRAGQYITAEPVEWVIEEEGEPLAKITQLPLRLAWAITIHKSQGMSLDAAVMDLSRVFEFGQGYVALSRVRTLSGVHLLGANDRAFQVSPAIVEQDREFRLQSETAQDDLIQIPRGQLEEKHTMFLKSCGWREVKDVNQSATIAVEKAGTKKNTRSRKSPLSVSKGNGDKLEQIRKIYPNAYTPWKTEEEVQLKEMFARHVPMDVMSEKLGRQAGSIRSRLLKLNLLHE